MIQTITIGLPGSEITLPTLGRTLQAFNYETVSISGRAADGTLHEDFISVKGQWSIFYSVLSEADRNIIFGIYNLQFTNSTFLSATFTDQASVDSNFTVRMSAPQSGPLVQRDVYYYNSVSFDLQEV